jgi:hypothetical protein
MPTHDPIYDEAPLPEVDAVAGPTLADLMAAAQMPVTVTEPDQLNGDGQMPYVKVDRVPEVALPLEAATLRFLDDARPLEHGPWTPGMLRMLRARTESHDGKATGDDTTTTLSWTAGMFEVLDGEGGRVVGHVAGEAWWRPGEEISTRVGPLLDYSHEAAEQLERSISYLEAGGDPAGPF